MIIPNSLNHVQLKDITDWIIPVDTPKDSVIYPSGSSIGEYDHLVALAVRISNLAAQHADQDDFSISLNNINLRVCRFIDVDKETLSIRQNANSVMDIDDIGLPPAVLTAIQNNRFLRTGLVIISGSHGGGKSTTCASIVKRRLELFGGVARTIEDPIEFPLSGRHGNGHCYQVPLKGDVSYDVEMEREIRKAMRGYPTGTNGILMLGEIRDAYTASEALRTSLAGRLLISTVHANKINDVIPRLTSRAESHMNQKEIYDILKSSLKMIIHQEIINNKLRVSCLFRTEKVSSVLHVGKIQGMNDEINRQEGVINRGGHIELFTG